MQYSKNMLVVMTQRVFLCLICLSLANVAGTSSAADIIPGTIVKETTPLKIGIQKKLRDLIAETARSVQGRVGVKAIVLETGQSEALNGEQRFPMQSVYKLPIAMAVLDQVDRGKLKLDRKVRIESSDIVQISAALDRKSQGKEFTVAELLQYMVSNSDNTACDVLLRLIGGPKMVDQYLQNLGLKDIVVANTEKELAQDQAAQYHNYTTPDAIAVLLRAVQEGRGLSKSSQALLQRLMTQTSTGLKRIKGLLPPGIVVIHKTGTSSTVNGVTAATNDVGLVTLPNGHHLAIAVFVSDAKADLATREAAIAKIARSAWDAWSK